MNLVTSGIILTRRCNLNCKYCAIPNRVEDDMTGEQWCQAIDIINKLKIKKVNFIGGEVTLYNDLLKVMSYATSKIDHCSLITNGIKNFDLVKKILDLGLKNISFSLDTLTLKNSISPVKAKAALELIENFEKENLLKKSSLTAYCVINRKNLNDIVELVKFLSSKNIFTYFLVYHWGKQFEHRKEDYGISLKNNQELNVLLKTLIDMKRKGFLISNSFEYFEMIPKYIDKLNWHCSSLFELRVDSNGRLMCCCDKMGEVYDKYTIFDLYNSEVLSKFLKEREEDASKCSGCLWSSSIESELLYEYT